MGVSVIGTSSGADDDDTGSDYGKGEPSERFQRRNLMARFTLRQLEYFVAVADHTTITAAARHCGASPAGLSEAISNLERCLGVDLLIRHRARGVALTPAGVRFAAGARPLLAEADDLEAVTRADGAVVAGRLAMACYTSLVPFLLPALLDEFALRHPKLQVDLVEGSHDELRPLLVGGACEIGLLYENGIGADLEYTVVQACRPYVILPADHRLASRNEVALADLVAEPLITFEVPPSADCARQIVADTGLEHVPGHRTTNIEMVRCLVARGLGWAIMVQRWPSAISYEGRPLVSRPIADPVDEFRVAVAWPVGTRQRRRATAVADFCRETFGVVGSTYS
ncbi:LysR family transcriptional regulator [Pseudonocardia sp. NPDC049635]|uniref:LysR family transcriptional regulator n=1 Tax=Pseudonocardia sp. NPDC049635 TaxID=3155506 RepID=UPI0033CAFAD8